MNTLSSRFIVFLGVLLSFTPAAQHSPLTHRAPRPSSGAIFTTDLVGQAADVFHAPGHAFLAGGFAPGSPCSGASLENGTYYFQVTDPSGTVLLSRDAIERRRVHVLGGVIAGVPLGGHTVRNGPCGSRLVQIQPFMESPSPDREYRIWLTPVSEFHPGTGIFGFDPASSKTDTFKVDGRTPVITQTKIFGTVFYDFNENGAYEPQFSEEVPLSGWKIEVDSGGVVTEVVTDADGRYEFLRDMTSTPHVLTSIAPLPGFIPAVGGQWLGTTSNPVNIVTNVDAIQADFGNLFFELNVVLGRPPAFWQSEAGCDLLAECDPDWRLRLNELCLRTHLTSPPHSVEDTLFTVPLDGTSDEACELLSDFLDGHDPDDRDDNDDDGDDDDDADDDDDSDDDDDGDDLDGDHDDDDECDGDDASDDTHDDVLAFVLSRQFVSAVLNVSCGPLQGLPTFIDQENDGVLVDLEDMIEHTQEMLCDPRSANTGPCGDEEWRAHILMCLDEWGGMNTDGTNTYTRRQNPPPIIYL